MSKATEQRVKQKLKTISKDSKVPFNSLLDTLFLERFLVRISKSQYADKLIFKGGMCLAQIIKLGRETKDIDFLLTTVKANLQSTKKIMKEIAAIKINDNFVFTHVSVEELSIEHKKYPGYRVSIQGSLGQIKNKITIDIGIGDVVRPKALDVELINSNGPLFEETISLIAYPPEYIFSEKLEAILYLGDINSRMKDFYDCYRMIEVGVLDKKQLKQAIEETLKNRQTTLNQIPTPSKAMNTKWQAFIKKNKIDSLDLSTVVLQINNFLKIPGED